MQSTETVVQTWTIWHYTEAKSLLWRDFKVKIIKICELVLFSAALPPAPVPHPQFDLKFLFLSSFFPSSLPSFLSLSSSLPPSLSPSPTLIIKWQVFFYWLRTSKTFNLPFSIIGPGESKVHKNQCLRKETKISCTCFIITLVWAVSSRDVCITTWSKLNAGATENTVIIFLALRVYLFPSLFWVLRQNPWLVRSLSDTDNPSCQFCLEIVSV